MQNIKNLKVYLESKILASNNVVIVPHMGIDFDAIASAIGLSQIAIKYSLLTSVNINKSFGFELCKYFSLVTIKKSFFASSIIVWTPESIL